MATLSVDLMNRIQEMNRGGGIPTMPQNRPKVRYFKIFVKDTGRPTINILEYLRDNVDIINEMGVKLKIKKITDDELDKDMVNKLANKGILRFPALVTDENKVRLGVKKIQSLFEGNKQSYQKYMLSQRSKKPENPLSLDTTDDSGLSSFYKQEMSLEAIEREKHNHDNEGFETGNSDYFNRRVSDQLNRRKINPNGSQSFDMDNMMARRAATAAPNPRRSLPEQTANIATDETPIAAPPRPKLPEPRTDGSGAGFDDSMFDRAFMEGVGDGYY